MDEIDAVGRHRGAGLGGGHDEREQTLNQLLVEMDGFETNEGVILIAATNRPDVLDPALLRPGRFDRQVVVARPDVKGREEILKVHSRRIPLAPKVELTVLARGTSGFSGADLANLVNEAALLAARQDKKVVEMIDFENAKDKVLMGVERRSMANLGLEHSLRESGIRVVKTQVGDRYVLEEMVRIGAMLGGEQSGHLLFLDHATTGDGIVSALQVLAVMRESGQRLSALARCLTKFPQVLVNVPVRAKPPLDSIKGLHPRLQTLEGEMNGAGRILLRYSGTELLARVMVEGQEQAQIEGIAQELAGIIHRAIGP